MQDRAVSLNAVLDVMHEMWGDSGELLDAIKQLPPVTPQKRDRFAEGIKYCEDCDHVEFCAWEGTVTECAWKATGKTVNNPQERSG